MERLDSGSAQTVLLALVQFSDEVEDIEISENTHSHLYRCVAFIPCTCTTFIRSLTSLPSAAVLRESSHRSPPFSSKESLSHSPFCWSPAACCPRRATPHSEVLRLAAGSLKCQRSSPSLRDSSLPKSTPPHTQHAPHEDITRLDTEVIPSRTSPA